MILFSPSSTPAKAAVVVAVAALRLLAGCPPVAESFSPALRFRPPRVAAVAGTTTTTWTTGPGPRLLSSTRLSTAAKEEEKVLREELARMTTQVKDEGKYGIGETESIESEEDKPGAEERMAEREARRRSAIDVEAEEEVSSVGKRPGRSLESQIERMTKPRAYPLFLAEIAAIALEGFWSKATKFGPLGELQVGRTDGGGRFVDPARALEGTTKKKEKERIVVLGTGWGAAAFLKTIDPDVVDFDVTVISPRNFFLFTPMLAGASVGTVEYRSITEPVREINSKTQFLEATATEIDPKTNTINCESVVCEGNSCTIEDFTVEYDKLVLTVGAQTNTFGIPGVREHCCFLKQVEDARQIRTAIVNCFERANIPSLTDEDRTATLTFAVIGAGPTGIEFASELRDFVEQDGPKYYPDLLKHVRIKVIEASSTVLAPFDKSLQEEAIKQLNRKVNIDDPAVLDLLPEQFQLTELLLDSGVSEVKEDVIVLNDKREIPYGLSVWAAGNGPLPITLNLVEALGSEGGQAEAQGAARGRIAVDPWLRVLGGRGEIFALGDCSCVVDGQLPATAQVAGQQGEYLARLLSLNYDTSPSPPPGAEGDDDGSAPLLPPRRDPTRDPTLSESVAAFAIRNDEYAAPFQFLNLGILAYTGGGSALAQLQVTPSDKTTVKGRGKIGFGLWRSVYLSKQVSWRNRFLVFVDWAKTQIFGRDITRI